MQLPRPVNDPWTTHNYLVNPPPGAREMSMGTNPMKHMGFCARGKTQLQNPWGVVPGTTPWRQSLKSCLRRGFLGMLHDQLESNQDIPMIEGQGWCNDPSK